MNPGARHSPRPSISVVRRARVADRADAGPSRHATSASRPGRRCRRSPWPRGSRDRDQPSPLILPDRGRSARADPTAVRPRARPSTPAAPDRDRSPATNERAPRRQPRDRSRSPLVPPRRDSPRPTPDSGAKLPGAALSRRSVLPGGTHRRGNRAFATGHDPGAVPQAAMLTKSTGTTNARETPGSRGNGTNVMKPEPEHGTFSVVGIGFDTP